MKKLITVLGVFSVAFLSQSAIAGYALFDAAMDTISVTGNSVIGTAMTIEARVNVVNVNSSYGNIFCEWTNAREDKYLLIRSDQTINSYLYHPGGFAFMASNATVSLNTWHHIAYVYDGSEERLYLDGIKVGSRAASGDVLDYSPSVAAVGAISSATIKLLRPSRA